MKTFKRIMVLALAVIMVLSMVACGKTETAENNPTNKPATVTPRTYICDVTAGQINNYIVKYTVTRTETLADADGVYRDQEVTTKNVEVGYSAIILTSQNDGETFKVGNASSFTISDANDTRSFFAAHMRYNKDQLENKGTEVINGVTTTHYYFKNGLIKIHLYVDESFGTTGMTVKYVDEGMNKQTIEITELKFDVISKEEGYDFVDFQSKVAVDTPAPAEPQA